jgi:NAD(P)-dependent dehydrogenase (short-subunit alcohol dehydrogenase family)
MSIRFDGRTAIVTGGGRGIGRSHALLLASRGANIVVNDTGTGLDGTGSDPGVADAVVKEIRAAGGRAVASYESVAEHESAANIVRAAVDAFGGVDILVNNAGIVRDRTFLKTTLDDFDAVVRTHFLGTAYVTHAAWPIMRERGYGRIVFTASNSGLYGIFGQSSYSAAKLAVVGLMNALRLEGLKYDVLVNTVAPVAVTRMSASVLPRERHDELTTDAVSPMVAYLCSDRCKHTGATWAAGAGYFSRAELREGPGVRLDAPTVDDVAANIDRIADLSTSAPFHDALEEVRALLGPERASTTRR